MRINLFIIFSFLVLIAHGQKIEDHKDRINQAKQNLSGPLNSFEECFLKSRLEICVNNLVKYADNEYKKYVIAGALFSVDKEKSYRLHKEAFLLNQNEVNFILEYAIELHRNKEYISAISQYERYLKEKPADYRVHVWLSECFINSGNVAKAVEHWNKAEHPRNHTGIDLAIHVIHGKTDQLKQRSDYREKIKAGNTAYIYPLLFLDLNWELNWWNTAIQESFMKEDFKLAKDKCNESCNAYIQVTAYINIKRLSADTAARDSIRYFLTKNHLILDNNPLPPYGRIASDLLRVCLLTGIMTEREFYDQRGSELLDLSKKTNDADLLNIYAYLQATIDNGVDEEIDKLGWKEFKDERFAISYFIGLAEKNRYDNPELNEALSDFPNSAALYWVKANCAKIENRDLKPDLIELIKREFMTLSSGREKNSYSLKSYFYYLKD